MDPDEMSILYRGTFIDAFYQVSVFRSFFSSPLPSFGVRRLLTFHILILSSATPQPNKLKLGRKHLWKVLSKDCAFCPDSLTNMTTDAKWWQKLTLPLARWAKKEKRPQCMTLEIQVLAWDRNKNVAGLYFQDFLSKIDSILSRFINKHGRHR
jgi:hypothetical protein